MGDSYLPPSMKKDEHVRIISPPTPPVDRELEIRMMALKCAAIQTSGAQFLVSSPVVIAHAKKYESYLRGEEISEVVHEEQARA